MKRQGSVVARTAEPRRTGRRVARQRPRRSRPGLLQRYPQLDRRFEAVVFDWDGTAVPDRSANASRARRLIEDLCAFGMEVVVVTGTHIRNVDGQLGARPHDPGHLHLCLNRGSEVFRVDEGGAEPVARRVASADEEAALTAAAEATVSELARRGLRAEIVSQRLNRRKIDLIPEPEWVDPPKARIGELLAAVEGRLQGAGLSGLGEVVELADAAAHEAGLEAPRVTSDAKHIEIGLTDKADSARWVFEYLRRRGIPPSLVLIAGDEFGPLGGLPGSDSFLLVPQAARAVAVSVGGEPTGVPENVLALGGGPPRFLQILRDQLRRRKRGDVPDVDSDPAWSLTVEGLDPKLERVHETLLTLSDGRIGTSGSPLGSHPAARPRVLAAGLYDGNGPETDLLPCPVWTRLDGELPADLPLRRQLDLRSGLLHQQVDGIADGLKALLFTSLARPGTAALRAQGASELVRSDAPLAPAGDDAVSGSTADRFWVKERASQGGVLAAAVEMVGSDRVERLATYAVATNKTPSRAAALRRLDNARKAGFERLLMEHREAWAQRWEEADIRIDGEDDLQRAIRFALFHLIGAVAQSGEAAVGARGLSGPAYRGHVFWDSDVFVLPFLAATHPAAARAMLEYRIRRLPQARATARAFGRDGARFPWESARGGVDVTPSHTHDSTGRVVPIRTGELEEHITADLAWTAAFYIDWTGDEAFAAGPGRQLFVESARYWASRIRTDNRGRAHIYGVIGPDEYHEPVDDNAYTNVMARWNLRRAAATLTAGSGEVAEEEPRMWLELADALVDGYDPTTGIYEQFAGFFGLEPLIIADVASRRPIAADLMLGADRVAAAQVLKQADVLMLHHLVPEAVAPDSLIPNLDFYEPRTAHGSSLSPAIHASLFARAGRLGHAADTLRLASRIDLDDLTGTTAGGVHLATMGGLWQAIAFGFVGLRAHDGVLEVDPRLPADWRRLEVPLRFQGRRVRLAIERDQVTVDAEPGVRIKVAEREGRRVVSRS
jgi:trehalose/maltose hydrolase-like predicted phosphorylase